MLQRAKSSEFIINEFVYWAFGIINNIYPEPFLLDSSQNNQLPTLTFYMDDFFSGFKDFESQFQFLSNHFLPHIDQAYVWLSFRKLKLFQSELRALGVIHCVGGDVKIVDNTIKTIMQFLEPLSIRDVKSFLRTVSITRQQVPNFVEIAYLLSKLIGKVDWHWGDIKKLSFEILKMKWATMATIYGIHQGLESHFYVDTSGYRAGLAITQRHQLGETVKDTKVPIIYDSFTFSKTQKKYLTYKRELCASIKLAIKYNYLYKNPMLLTTIHTKHKSLTSFCQSSCHKKIYGYWADQLQKLRICIVYIFGPWNKVADGLSRTISRNEDNNHDKPHISTALKLLKDEGKEWIQKDGVGSYEDFLKSFNQYERKEVLESSQLYGVDVFAFGLRKISKLTWTNIYQNSEQFGRIYWILLQEEEAQPKEFQKSF